MSTERLNQDLAGLRLRHENQPSASGPNVAEQLATAKEANRQWRIAFESVQEQLRTSEHENQILKTELGHVKLQYQNAEQKRKQAQEELEGLRAVSQAQGTVCEENLREIDGLKQQLKQFESDFMAEKRDKEKAERKLGAIQSLAQSQDEYPEYPRQCGDHMHGAPAGSGL